MGKFGHVVDFLRLGCEHPFYERLSLRWRSLDTIEFFFPEGDCLKQL